MMQARSGPTFVGLRRCSTSSAAKLIPSILKSTKARESCPGAVSPHCTLYMTPYKRTFRPCAAAIPSLSPLATSTCSATNHLPHRSSKCTYHVCEYVCVFARVCMCACMRTYVILFCMFLASFTYERSPCIKYYFIGYTSCSSRQQIFRWYSARWCARVPRVCPELSPLACSKRGCGLNHVGTRSCQRRSEGAGASPPKPIKFSIFFETHKFTPICGVAAV
jgi:hypothetical protein